MRILIDMQGTQSPTSKNRGVGRYTLEMAKALIAVAQSKHEILLVANGSFPESLEQIRKEFKNCLPPKNIKCWQQHANPVAGIDGNSWRKSAAELSREWYLSQLHGDIIWSTNLQEGWFDSAVTSVKRIPSNSLWCTTLHDVIPLLYPEKYLSTHIKSWYEEKIAFAKKSDVILTVSEYSKREICRLLKVNQKKVVVATNAYNPEIFNSHSIDFTCCADIVGDVKPEKYVLYTGGADDHKNLHRLISAFGLLPPNLKTDYSLVMVGGDVKGQEQHLRALAFESGIEDRNLVFTGFVSDHQLVNLYSCCALLVHPAYSEGFGLPVLEALATGAPVIGADAASIPEIIDYEDALFDPFNVIEMATKIESVLTNRQFRINLIEKGKKRAAEFSWLVSARRVCEAFENAQDKHRIRKTYSFAYESLIRRIGKIGGSYSTTDLVNTARSIAESTIPNASVRTCYVDLSCLVHFDHATGIQRVVRAIASVLFDTKNSEIFFAPIFSYAGHTHFYHVATRDGKFEVPDEAKLGQHRVDFKDGDIILLLDLHPGSAISKASEIQNIRNRGVLLYFVLYDLIPLSHPQYFVEQLSDEFGQWVRTLIMSDGVLCISEDVASKLKEFISRNALVPSVNFKIRHFHLGADLASSVPSAGLPPGAAEALSTIKKSKSFLMVGTVEPRKGHSLVLDAFEALWDRGDELVLVIVGREGWRNEETIERLRRSPENSKRLFWLEGISDEYLEKVYAACTCLIAASEAEGFGLPLIEAAKHGLPIIARNLDVFREVAGDHAFYFDGISPSDLVLAIDAWLGLLEGDKHPKSEGMQLLTWADSAAQLLQAMDIYQ